ncbi:Serine/threonine-protein kinase haspin [Paramyrothecium foliicola]|nr:Serine/threonine-protein kinase haspin [Paramyrothecium foliicola]
MSQTAPVRKYGKQSKKSKAERLFAELPQSPIRRPPATGTVDSLTKQLSTIQIEDEPAISPRTSPRKARTATEDEVLPERITYDSRKTEDELESTPSEHVKVNSQECERNAEDEPIPECTSEEPEQAPNLQWLEDAALRTLGWDEVSPPGDRIEKIAEASYAEVYRVTNERGTSIIKVIRLPSPIKPQTKAQVKSGLVDEEPHSPDDVQGELQISEWLADIPGFVVYKQRYIVQGKTTRQLLETHQAFQKKMKKQDPDRAQFYPSPSRYLDDTRFLVVELGDAGKALEDWELSTTDEIWDIFFLEAIALARAEELVMFEHRDLHEGNLCIRRVRDAVERNAESDGFFGFSGLDITILDYGLSRAEDLSVDEGQVVALDLERDLSLFTSTHAPQCKVYRQMRSFLLRGDRKCLPPKDHNAPYAKGVDGPLTWDAYAPYTNVLWLAYLYEYLLGHFVGDKKELAAFKKETKELWKYLNPNAKDNVPCFGGAADVVCFAVEAGWIGQEQLTARAAMSINGYSAVLRPTPGMNGSGTPAQDLLASSISSLSAPAGPRQSSHISKTYRQASTLFLTRRLPEALTTLIPLITPPATADDGELAPVAKSSRTTRVKVWSLYLTILNAVIELEAEEGKNAFGTQEWRALCSKVRDGNVWEDVVRNGYHGVEGDVDPDVVINLATLLLAHAPDQAVNQKRLEAYLAACNTPNLDLAGRLSEASSPKSRMSSRYRSPAKGTSGANTPRDLNARVKILELYTLHVLLRNNEWDYAREFICASSVLDEERRDAFLQALESLREDQLEQERQQEEEQQRQEEQLRKDVEDARKQRLENEARERKRVEEERARREGSEVDYGVEETPSVAGSSQGRHKRTASTPAQPPRSAVSRPKGKPAGPLTLTARASLIITRFRAIIDQLSASLNSNPMVLMRFLAFVAGMLLVLGHKGLRERVQRILGASWNKVKSTAGMGAKVSYI